MIYQSQGEKYNYLCSFTVENYDFLCRLANRNDESVAYVLNSIVANYRKRHIGVPTAENGHVTNGPCLTK